MSTGVDSQQIHTNGSMPEDEIHGDDLLAELFARPELLAATAFLGGFLLAAILRRGRSRRSR